MTSRDSHIADFEELGDLHVEDFGSVYSLYPLFGDWPPIPQIDNLLGLSSPRPNSPRPGPEESLATPMLYGFDFDLNLDMDFQSFIPGSPQQRPTWDLGSSALLDSVMPDPHTEANAASLGSLSSIYSHRGTRHTKLSSVQLRLSQHGSSSETSETLPTSQDACEFTNNFHFLNGIGAHCFLPPGDCEWATHSTVEQKPVQEFLEILLPRRSLTPVPLFAKIAQNVLLSQESQSACMMDERNGNFQQIDHGVIAGSVNDSAFVEQCLDETAASRDNGTKLCSAEVQDRCSRTISFLCNWSSQWNESLSLKTTQFDPGLWTQDTSTRHPNFIENPVSLDSSSPAAPPSTDLEMFESRVGLTNNNKIQSKSLDLLNTCNTVSLSCATPSIEDWLEGIPLLSFMTSVELTKYYPSYQPRLSGSDAELLANTLCASISNRPIVFLTETAKEELLAPRPESSHQGSFQKATNPWSKTHEYTSLHSRFARSGDSSGSAGSAESVFSKGSHDSLVSHASWAGRKGRRRNRVPTPPLFSQRLDGGKPYHCTWCSKLFCRPSDWKRHEESQHAPQTEWICMPNGPSTSINACNVCALCGLCNPSEFHLHHDHNQASCLSTGSSNRRFDRKDHLVQHLRIVHGVVLPRRDLQTCQRSLQGTEASLWKCGFCYKMDLVWQQRYLHVAGHMKGATITAKWIDCVCTHKSYSPNLHKILHDKGLGNLIDGHNLPKGCHNRVFAFHGPYPLDFDGLGHEICIANPEGLASCSFWCGFCRAVIPSTDASASCSRLYHINATHLCPELESCIWKDNPYAATLAKGISSGDTCQKRLLENDEQPIQILKKHRGIGVTAE